MKSQKSITLDTTERRFTELFLLLTEDEQRQLITYMERLLSQQEGTSYE